MPALLMLVTFICATGFYIAGHPTPALDGLKSSPAVAAVNEVASKAIEKPKVFINRQVTLTLYSRIIESFATTEYPTQLTLFPQINQFQSVFPHSQRRTAFFDTHRVYSEQTVTKLQSVVPMESSSRQPAHKKTTGTTMMLEYLGTGFPNLGSWLDEFSSLEAVAANFSHRGVPQALLPRQYFRPLLTDDALANVKCNGHSAATVNRRADQYRTRVQEIADRYNVDPNLVLAVAAQESCFHKNAISPVGAQGLMQLMPATASMLGVRDAYNAIDNLKGGVRYLSMLQKQFDSQELVLAAYNAGPGSVRRFNGIPPYSETQNYVSKVLSFYRSFEAAEDYSYQ